MQIIDLRINNLSSLVRAVNGIEVPLEIEVVSDTFKEVSNSKVVILPGVGNFGSAMESLKSRNLDAYLINHISDGGKLIGICLGMQLLLTRSDESQGVSGLGAIPGVARKLSAAVERVPNVGWNNLSYVRSLHKPPSFTPESNFYFTHSYFADVSEEFVIAKSKHGSLFFPAVIGSSSVLGIQFHPEKSGLDGKLFLKEVIERLID